MNPKITSTQNVLIDGDIYVLIKIEVDGGYNTELIAAESLQAIEQRAVDEFAEKVLKNVEIERV